MEQQKLGCDYPNIHNIHNAANPDAGGIAPAPKPVFLRRVSQSSPHLDIPHFVNAQEKSFNSFHHVLSGLVEGNSSFGVNKKNPVVGTEVGINMPSSPDLTPLAGSLDRKPSLDRNKSAVDLSNNLDTSAAGGLRKVASIANYNLACRDSNSSSAAGTPPTSTHHLSPFAHHFGHLNSSSHHSISTIPEDHSQDQGLMMSVRPSGGIAANAASTSSLGASRQGLLDGPSSATSSPPKSALGGVMGVFGRGFFAKPVIRSDEENYRYILALDRN